MDTSLAAPGCDNKALTLVSSKYKERYNLSEQKSGNVIMMTRSRRLIWEGHTAPMGEMRNP
jgi:hypothetical protein